MNDYSADLPCFLDFEASDLALDSYPIQVAYSMPDGTIKSHFILPAEGWVGWSYEAQEVHRIPRDLLLDVGRPVLEVAEAMNRDLGQHNVAFVDGGMFDQAWLDRLFEAAGIAPEFVLESFQGLIYDEAPALFGGLSSPRALDDRWRQIEDEARSRVEGRRHLADNDVEYLKVFYRIAQARQRSAGAACAEIRL